MDAKLLKQEAKSLKSAALFAGISGCIFALFSIFSLNIFGGLSWYQTIAALFLVVGYAFAMQSFGRLGADKEAKQLKLAALLAFCAMVCAPLPLIGKYFAGILIIVASVFLLLAAKQLKAEHAAFKLLFIGAIIEIVAGVLVMLPVISIIGRLCEIAFWVLVIVAGVKLAKAE